MTKWLGIVVLGWGLAGCGGQAAPQAPAKTAAPTPAPEPAVTHWSGSRVSLWVPKEMRRPTRLAFFKMDDPVAVIAIAEMTAPGGAPVTEMLEGARSGSELTDEQPVTRGNAKGFIGKAKSDETGRTRQLLGLGEGSAAAVIVAQYDERAAPVVQRILDSVELDAKAKLDPLALHGVGIGDMAGFETWDAASQPIILADQGARPPIAAGVATFAFMSMPYPKPEISDDELGQMLGSVVGKLQPDMAKAKMDTFKISGTDAFVVAVPGQKDGKPVGVYAFILRRPDSAFLGWGDVALSEFEKTLPRYERLVKSVRLDDTIFTP